MRILKKSVSLLLVIAMLCSCFMFLGINASALSPLPHLLQADEPWGSYLVGGATIARTGCGILSLVNCVGYLTGKRMDVVECAEWAYSVKGFNNYSNSLGTYRLVLYPKVQAKYGAEYGFTVDCNTGDSGWWVSDASSKVLKNHLANGGVAIGMIPGHFIAMVDYDATTNKFHVLDSAPAAYRGTSSNRGDVWLSESHFTESAGYSYQLQWFCLLSATGTPADEQDNEKEYLEQAIANAETARYDNYSESALNSLRSAYNSALTVLNSSSSTSENYKSAREALESAINFTPSISVGKTYTATATNRGDDYDDDGKKLTDGKKGSNAPDTSAYAGWKNQTEIVIDLGKAKASNYYNVYLAGGDWGIEIPKDGEFNVAVSSSNDGTNFTSVASSSTLVKSKLNGLWEILKVTAVSQNSVNARYIKFTITCTAKNNFIWLDEVEVCSGDLLLGGGAYINKMNKKVTSGDCVVFTPDFGTISTTTANHTYTKNILVKWSNEKDAYVVQTISDGVANLPAELTLASDELLISAHDWETGVSENHVEGSAVNAGYIASAKVGDIVYLNGVDADNNKLSVASYLKLEASQSDTNLGDIDGNGAINSMDYVMLRRMFFGIYEIANEAVGDIDGNGAINSMDYVMLRRVFFGIYSISVDSF
ncbi:MAG: hypothetical protein E7586_02050 [Ruminococcaceae bacterium]|nr:hypothetical protein [Oscillospiraceae bacterium]